MVFSPAWYPRLSFECGTALEGCAGGIARGGVKAKWLWSMVPQEAACLNHFLILSVANLGCLSPPFSAGPSLVPAGGLPFYCAFVPASVLASGERIHLSGCAFRQAQTQGFSSFSEQLGARGCLCSWIAQESRDANSRPHHSNYQ